MAEVAGFVFDSRRPGRFFRLDAHGAAGHVDVPRHRVEDEELGLRTEVGDVTDAGRLEVGLGAFRERTRVAVIALARRRFDHVAGDDQRVLFAERIHAGRVRIGQQQHVGRFDALPAADRRTVEGVAVFELFFVEHLGRHRDVLLLALCVRETEVNEEHFVVRHHFHYVLGRRHRCVLLFHAWLNSPSGHRPRYPPRVLPHCNAGTMPKPSANMRTLH
jgi:hypothetical protein